MGHNYEGPTQRRWQSPSALVLLGEPSATNNAACLTVPIEPASTVTVSLLADDVLEIESIQHGMPVEIAFEAPSSHLDSESSWASGPATVVSLLRKAGHVLPGLSVAVDDPAESLAIAAAIADLCGFALSNAELLGIGHQVDTELGVPRSWLGQLTAVFGQDGQALLCDPRSMTAEAIPLELDVAGVQLLVIDCVARSGALAALEADWTEITRQLGHPLAAVGLDELEECAANLSDDVLGRRLRYLVSENDRALAGAQLLRAGHIREAGALLNDAHASVHADLGQPLAEVDLAVEVMGAFDAFGARAIGDGFAVGLLTPRQARAGALAIRSAFSGRRYEEPISTITYPAPGLGRVG